MTSYTTLYYRCFPSWDAMLLCCEKSRNYRHSWRFQISIGKKLITINKWKCWVHQTFRQLIFESNIRDNNSYSFHSTAAFHPMIESIYSKVHCIHISGWRFKWHFFIRCNILILNFNWYYFYDTHGWCYTTFRKVIMIHPDLRKATKSANLELNEKVSLSFHDNFFSLMLIFHQNAVQYIINAFIIHTCFWYWA